MIRTKSVNKTFFSLGILLFFLATTLHVSAKDDVLLKRRQLFDNDWKFHLGDVSNSSSTNFDDSKWRKLDLPHDWSIEGKVDPKNPMGNDGGYFPAGLGWYRKTFIAPSSLKGKKVSIYFEGVYMNAEVFINGKSLGIRPYGYSSFTYDLTPYLAVGKSNTLAVKVDNSQQKNSRWYSGSGIYRHVWLFVTDAVHFTQWGTKVTTPTATKNNAQVNVKSTVKNETGKTQVLSVAVKINNRENKLVTSKKFQVSIKPDDTKEILGDLSVNHPSLWSIESPNMYSIILEISKEGKIIDQIKVPFGIRTLNFSAKNGFLLNGKEIKINGGCAHHDNGPLGAAAYDRAEIKKVELLKASGFNSVRTSHNPPSEAFLTACDRLGVLVIDESFDGWRTKKTDYDYAKVFDAWWERDIEAMVLRDLNHPSIIMWSIGNEIIERKEPQAVETAHKLAKLVRKLDPSRPVTSAITTWDKDWEILDDLFAAHDIGGYNYQLHRAEADHNRVPSRIIVQTESYPRDAFKNWKLVTENKYIIGDYVWTAMDYLGESGIGRHFYKGETEGEHYSRDIYPWHGAYCGDIDLIGWRKPIAHYRELLYSKSKKLYLAVKEPDGYYGKINETMWSVWPTWESWNWPGHEGKNIEVEVYANYPKVRLYLNNKLVGEKPTGKPEEFKAVFILPYSTGTLKAVAVVNGKEVVEKQIVTADKEAKIKLTADRKTITADGQDLSYISVDITDENGVIQPNATNKLTFEVIGEAVIVAVGNADLKDLDSYVSNERKAWKGKALVIIKSTNKAGDISLKVKSTGLQGSMLKIRSI